MLPSHELNALSFPTVADDENLNVRSVRKCCRHFYEIADIIYLPERSRVQKHDIVGSNAELIPDSTASILS